MTPQDYKRITELFLKAAALHQSHREEFLDDACRDDPPEVRERVERMLAAESQTVNALDQATGFIGVGEAVIHAVVDDPEHPGRNGEMTDDLPAADGEDFPGVEDLPRLGSYRLLRVLGRGGMGVVYEAQQESPRRKVALKVISSGGLVRPDSQLLDRFKRETKLLGRLQHPGIARIYEAGVAEIELAEGDSFSRPFFTMELIRGDPIDVYAENERLSLQPRLRLMIKICEAVHHAHLRGVIHRDLKPANILIDTPGHAGEEVASNQADEDRFRPSASGRDILEPAPQPKILDFGVSRATDADIKSVSLQTDIGELIGTIPYMSPEQIGGDTKDIDIRSDVYGLGVICFKLLTGRLPHEVHDRSIPDAVRIIRDTEAARMSSIDTRYRGDLETIITKTLEKDKTRRYQSAAALAEDIRRYLNDEPIAAVPPSAIYRLRKFSRRHQGLVGGVVGMFVLLVAGIFTTSVFAYRAAEQRDYAQTQAEEAQRQTTRALRQERIAGETNNFLRDDLFAFAAPEHAMNPDITMKEVLDIATEKISDRYEDEPLVEAAIRMTLADTYFRLSDHRAGVAHARRAFDLRQHELGENHPDTLDAALLLGELYSWLNQFENAEPLLKRGLRVSRDVHGTHPTTARFLRALAEMQLRQGRYDQAEGLLKEGLAIVDEIAVEPDDTARLAMTELLTQLYTVSDRYPEAEAMGLEHLRHVRARYGREHPVTLGSMNNLATVYRQLKRFGEAEKLQHEAIELSRRINGPDHEQTRVLLRNFALMYAQQGRVGEAMPLYQEAYEADRASAGDDHPLTHLSGRGLAMCYLWQGRVGEAEELLMIIYESQARTSGRDHPNTFATGIDIAQARIARQRYEQAETMLTDILQRTIDTLGEHCDFNVAIRTLLGNICAQTNRPAEAKMFYLKALETEQQLRGENSPATLDLLARMEKLRPMSDPAEK